MPAKRSDSTRSLGFVTICSDRPTREKLKALAAESGLTLAEYLRVVAEKSGPVQGVIDASMTPQSRLESQMTTYYHQVVSMTDVIPMSEKRRRAIVWTSNRFMKFGMIEEMLSLYNQLDSELDAVIKREDAREAGQTELAFNGGQA